MSKHRADITLLEEAVEAYREALKVYTPEHGALKWAMTQNNLGNALVNLGNHKRDGEAICAALASYVASWKTVNTA